MKTLTWTLAFLVMTATGIALAHHSVPGEFGPSSRATIYVEGEIVKIMWRNPHVFINFKTTGGEVEDGQNWRLTTHPIHILRDTYDFHPEQFAVGDTIRMHGWTHLRGQPMFHPRALQVNDGRMRSLLRFADARDIVAGTFDAKGITPTKTLDGSNPGRAGKETVDGLRELGYLDENDMIQLPEDFKKRYGLLAEPKLDGTWVLTRGGKLFPPVLTKYGAAFKDNYDFKNDDPSLRCVPAGWSRVFSNPNTPFEIIQSDDSIRIRHELFDIDRTVPLAKSDAELTHVQGDKSFATLGQSVAWYDGDALLIHSTNFGNQERVLSTIRSWAGVPQSPLMVTLERYHLDGDNLIVEITHFDPIMYSEPLLARHQFEIDNEYEVLPYGCDPGTSVIVTPSQLTQGPAPVEQE